MYHLIPDTFEIYLIGVIMTDPRKYLFRMLIFIFIVSAIVVVLNKPLIGAFKLTLLLMAYFKCPFYWNNFLMQTNNKTCTRKKLDRES